MHAIQKAEIISEVEGIEMKFADLPREIRSPLRQRLHEQMAGG